MNTAQRFLKSPTLFLLLFSLLIFLVRLFFRGQVLEIDEAEQMVMGQQFLLGYPFQPPLYTWLQYGIFSLLAPHYLAGLALLKSLLIFGCLYYYHKICRLSCDSNALAWCATLAWVAIPALSLDLIKDNTHSVLVLFAACLTWYWFLAPTKLSQIVWYFFLGCIVGIGLLAKFNYLLFLSLFIISAMSLPEYRCKLGNKHIFLALIVSVLIASPYFFWLLTHQDIGFHGSFKLIAEDKSHWSGLYELLKTSLFFISPCLIIAYLVFPLQWDEFAPNPKNALVHRFFLICLPFLCAIVGLGGINHFATHWLIPFFFVTPVFYFSKVKMKNKFSFRIREFLKLALLVELIFLFSLCYRSYLGKNLRYHFPLEQVTTRLKKENQRIDTIASDSLWLIGNLMLRLSVHKGWLFHPAKALQLPPKGHLLVIWQKSKPPIWAEYFMSTGMLQSPKSIQASSKLPVIAGYAYIELFPAE